MKIKAVHKYTKFVLLISSLLFIGVGLMRSEHLTVLKKAINICLECIGVG
jgi:hypothetical protein